MSVMPRHHEWTVADLVHTPDDGLRDELVDGVLLVSRVVDPAVPSVRALRLLDSDVGSAEGDEVLRLDEPFPVRIVPRDLLDL